MIERRGGFGPHRNHRCKGLDHPDIGSVAREVFQTAEGAGITTNNPVFKAALTCLAERAPDRFAFDELCAATRDRLTGTAVADPIPEDQLRWFAADVLRQGALARLFDLHVCPAPSTPCVSENSRARPRATSSVLSSCATHGAPG
jgi:hypothetical protein